MIPFGETVLLWRLHRGLSQDQLAQAAAVSRPNLSAIERGQREVTLRTLRSLAAALDVRPGVLADGEPPQAVSPLGRDESERIARAVLADGVVATTSQRALIADLRSVLGSRLAASGIPGNRAGGRERDRAYLRLKVTLGADGLASLLARVTDHLARTST